MKKVDTHLPAGWETSIPHLPLLAEARAWEPLRKWGLSEVWRVTLHSGRTCIAKRTNGSMLKEYAIYRELLIPLGISRPRLLSGWQTETVSYFLLEDVGHTTLEQQPESRLFMLAARQLARIRCSTTHQLQEQHTTVPANYYTTADHFLQALNYLQAHPAITPEYHQILNTTAKWLPAQLTTLYSELPATLCHNDYHVKNLVLNTTSTTQPQLTATTSFAQNTSTTDNTTSTANTATMETKIITIDWAMASISPYHGDLYSLLRNAAARNVSCQEVLAAYEHELHLLAQQDPCAQHLLARPLKWQHAMGGICILLTSIEWILREAYKELPESTAWIPKMFASMQKCTTQIVPKTHTTHT